VTVLSDEQEFLREAASGTNLSRKTSQAARDALDRQARRAARSLAERQGGRLAGLLIDEQPPAAPERRFDAMLVSASAAAARWDPALGHYGRTANWATAERPRSHARDLARGERRVRLSAGAADPATSKQRWSADYASGLQRGGHMPNVERPWDGRVSVSG